MEYSRTTEQSEEERKGEVHWIESEWLMRNSASSHEEWEEDFLLGTDMFADPDPLETFSFQWKRINNPCETVQITLTGYKTELGQTLGSTGLTLWRASSILCDYIVSQEDKILAIQNLLELGAGLGLCGILASKLGAPRVVLTDGDSNALARMRDNLHLNSCSSTSCHQLVWGEDLDRFDERHGTFDLILGSDIIYVEEIIEPLWNTVDRLLIRDGEFWLAFARRNVSIDLVLDHAGKHGYCWKTPETVEGVYIFRRASALP